MTKQERIVLEQFRDSLELMLNRPPEPESVTEGELRKCIADRDRVIAERDKTIAKLHDQLKRRG